MPWTADKLAELQSFLGADGVLSSEAARFTYEADALALEKFMPDVIVLPRSTDEVAAIVRWARANGVPVTPRGAGTGLAGGATPEQGGIVLSMNRMDQLLRVDPERMFAWAQPGLVNLQLSQLVAEHGLYFAPDPSSQPVSTVGGNVATNAGGPHCLKYGVTFNHVLGIVVVLHDGAVVTLGGEALDSPDFDLASTVIGSEGTLAVVTEACVRLLPKPEAVKTMLFDFVKIESACQTVSDVIAAGIVPAAMEIMDHLTTSLVEEWLQLGLPLDADGVLLIEVDGPAVSLADQVVRITEHAKANGSRSVRVAADDHERALLWKARKSAFGAYGRSASGFYIMDGVVPRARLAEALSTIQRVCNERGLRSGNVFHAGDGNLHPHVLFDADDPAEQQNALDASHEILRMCIAMGGSISGEHGVGIEKRSMMSEQFSDQDLDEMEKLRAAFDPDRVLNPGKILPSGGGCREFHPPSMGGQVLGDGQKQGPWI